MRLPWGAGIPACSCALLQSFDDRGRLRHDGVAGHDDAPVVRAAREVVHDVDQQVLDDRPEPTGAGLSRYGLPGYRVYRRISSDGLNSKPWFPVATLGPDARSASIDLRQYPENNYFFSRTERYGVSTIGENGIESSIISTL